MPLHASAQFLVSLPFSALPQRLRVSAVKRRLPPMSLVFEGGPRLRSGVSRAQAHAPPTPPSGARPLPRSASSTRSPASLSARTNPSLRSTPPRPPESPRSPRPSGRHGRPQYPEIAPDLD